jgi:hypothetical protein
VLTRSLLDDFNRFQTTTRVTAAKRSEGNRRTGGIKTQASTVKIWNVSASPPFLPILAGLVLTVYFIWAALPQRDTPKT